MPQPLKHTASKGDVFHMLTLLKVLRKRSANGGLRALVRCECGNVKAVAVAKMRKGTTRSCGCWKNDQAGDRLRAWRAAGNEGSRTHGLTPKGNRHPMYNTWYHMLARCEEPDEPGYEYYGGRGITVCDDWHELPAFVAYMTQLDHYGEPGRTMDRIDPDGNYEPGNVRFATQSTQNRNKRVSGESGYYGVRLRNYVSGTRYRAYAYKDGRQVNLREYATAEEAAAVRDEYVREHIPDAPLNFPDEERQVA